MKAVPIVSHYAPRITAGERRDAEQLAGALLKERPQLRLDEQFSRLVPRCIDDAPTLHVTDLTEIPHLDQGLDVRFYQQRARLRAGDGDLLATTALVPPEYETYCQDTLGLGEVTWLYPRPPNNPLRVADACWEDEQMRRLLLQRIRSGQLRYLHPHMGTLAVWALAALLSDAARHVLHVIAPPPRVTKWANNKVEFTNTVRRLLGPAYVPATRAAWNLAMLTHSVEELSACCPMIAIKLPDSGGGDGTVVLDSRVVQGRNLHAIRELLRSRIATLDWNGETELLVDSWETSVLASPSAQLWIPPREAGEPVLEGLFDQLLAGATGIFVGSVPAQLPPAAIEEIVNCCGRLGHLFQQLGYVGRCSFDMLLVGDSLSQARLEFIECNGRWGGASAPMTLMNRLFGDWLLQAYAYRVCTVTGLQDWTFPQLLDYLGDRLYDRRTGRGYLVLSLPGRVQARSAVDVLALGDTVSDALTRIEQLEAELGTAKRPPAVH